MLAYKPAQAPLSRKLLGSWAFQVSVLALVLLCVYVIIRDRAHKTLSERIAEIEEAPQTRATVQNSEAAPPPPSAQEFSSNANAAASQSAQLDGATAERANLADSQPTGGAQPQSVPQPNYPPGAEGFNRAAEDVLGEPARPAAATGQVRTLRLQFIEAQKAVVGDLAANARNLVEAAFTGGVVGDLASRIQTYRQSMRPLDAASDYPVRLNQPIIAFKGTRDEASGQNIGVTVQLTPISSDETGVAVQTEVMRVLREAGGTVSEQSFQETFVIPKEGGAFMAGTVRPRQLTSEESTFYRNASVLRVMASPSFQQQATDFVILIQGK